MNSTFDPAAIAAAELLSMFGKNTAIRIDHKYGQHEIRVCVARTGNVISDVMIHEKGIVIDELFIAPDMETAANVIKGKKKFPKPRNMKRSWSPIRLSEKAREELDIRKATMNGYFA